MAIGIIGIDCATKPKKVGLARGIFISGVISVLEGVFYYDVSFGEKQKMLLKIKEAQ